MLSVNTLYLSSLLEGNRPLRDFSYRSCFASFLPLTRMRRDLEPSSTRIQGSSALHHCTRVSSPQQRPEASSSLAFRLGSMLSVNKRTNCLPSLPPGSRMRPSPPRIGSTSMISSSHQDEITHPLPRNKIEPNPSPVISLCPNLLLTSPHVTRFILACLQVLVIRTRAGMYLAPPKCLLPHHHH